MKRTAQIRSELKDSFMAGGLHELANLFLSRARPQETHAPRIRPNLLEVAAKGSINPGRGPDLVLPRTLEFNDLPPGLDDGG
jgi:hypothetical protein